MRSMGRSWQLESQANSQSMEPLTKFIVRVLSLEWIETGQIHAALPTSTSSGMFRPRWSRRIMSSDNPRFRFSTSDTR